MVLLYSTLKRRCSLSYHLLPPANWKAGVLAGAPATTLGYEAQGHTLGTVGQNTGRSTSQGCSGKFQCQLWTAHLQEKIKPYILKLLWMLGFLSQAVKLTRFFYLQIKTPLFH